MDFALFFRGVVIGFSIAAPVGPIGVLCIRRTIASGVSSGLVSGLGAATADALYGLVAGLGLAAVSRLLTSLDSVLHLAGGGFLLYLGLTTARARPSEIGATAGGGARGLLAAFLSTLVLTLTNPATILSFAAVFAGLGALTGNGSQGSILAMVAGVFVGSALWWLILCLGVGRMRGLFAGSGLTWVNRASGATIVFLALWSILATRL